MIKVLIADDQEMVRSGMVALLSYQKDLSVVAQAAHGEEAIALARDFQPDVILMDIRMPVCDGITATETIRRNNPDVKILVLTTFDEEQLVVRALQAGASGYLLKDTPSDQIAGAIRAVHSGTAPMSPVAMARIVANLSAARASTRSLDLKKLLTNREIEVLKLIGDGKNNKEIAALLNITEGTVKNHVTHIFAQIGARDRVEAAIIAQHHLLTT
ncbi:MAG TPA: response regulator transcription factor [Candidatus Obscuribacterales bacterium]